MKGLAEINAENAAIVKRADASRRAALYRLKKRIARLFFVDAHPRREAFKRDINLAIDAWAAAERKRGAR